MHFTGYQRDGESGLDDANARYYGSALGRFTRPDPLGIASADPTNPQSLNEYAYVMNNPLNMIDPTGLDFEGDGGDGGDGGDDGCDFCEGGGSSVPPIMQGPAHTSGHTPFPVPGQGIDWLNWLFGPACTGGPIGNPCITSYHNTPNGVVPDDGDSVCYGDGTCYYYWLSLNDWMTTKPPSEDDNRIKQLAKQVVKGAGAMANPCTWAAWYGASAVAAVAGEWVVGDNATAETVDQAAKTKTAQQLQRLKKALGAIGILGAIEGWGENTVQRGCNAME